MVLVNQTALVSHTETPRPHAEDTFSYYRRKLHSDGKGITRKQVWTSHCFALQVIITDIQYFFLITIISDNEFFVRQNYQYFCFALNQFYYTATTYLIERNYSFILEISISITYRHFKTPDLVSKPTSWFFLQMDSSKSNNKKTDEQHRRP